MIPVELARRCVATGCPPGGLVRDPFSGMATTGVAVQVVGEGRRYLGIDANGRYNRAAEQRLEEERAKKPWHGKGGK